jgi:hypothetical protein
MAAANFGRIDRLGGNPALRGDRSGYNIPLLLSKPSVELTAHASVDNTNNNEGIRIDWGVTQISSGVSSATHSFTPGDSTPLDANGKATVTIQFVNAQISDKFSITAELKDANGQTIGANATVGVSFAQAIDLTGVSLNLTTLTVRENREGFYLTATPNPPNATNVSYAWSSQNQDVVTPVQDSVSPDMARVTVAKAGKTKIIVTATGENNSSFTASCDVEVVGQGSIADDMIVKPITDGEWKPNSGDDVSTLYGAD